MSKLSKLQLSNLGAVIGLLTAIPDKDYNHRHFGANVYDRDSANPNAVCAVGHAFKNPGKFRAEVADEDRNLFQRMFGIRTSKPETDHGSPRQFACDVFGAPLYRHAFDADAYDMSPSDVTKNMVLARLCKVRELGAIPA